MKVPQTNYYGLNHEGVQKKFSGELTFMNTISVNGTPCAVYKAKTPDKAKGHKKYMLLSMYGETMYVSGMTASEIKKYRVATAVHCLECDRLIVSVGRHDYVVCGCPNNAMVDGGDCYSRVGAQDLTRIRQPSVDLITRKIIK